MGANWFRFVEIGYRCTPRIAVGLVKLSANNGNDNIIYPEFGQIELKAAA